MIDDLLAALVAVDSVNPTLVPGAAGEAEVAALVARWCAQRGLEVEQTEVAPGRPNVVARRRGTGGGPTLLLLAHTDTVSTAGMADALVPRVVEGVMRGRGTYDMKGGLAAAMVALAELPPLRGDVVLAAVCDEEAGGLGTRALLAAGERFDAAIVTEPTDLEVAVGHKGYAAFTFTTSGVAAHGSRPDLGEDAILKMGHVLLALEALEAELAAGPGHPLLGRGSLHASTISGGVEASSYPASCTLVGEWRTVPGDDAAARLRAVAAASGVDPVLGLPYTGTPFTVSPDDPFAQLVLRHAGTAFCTPAYWADSALLAEAGIPTVLLGPAGGGAHAIDERVDLASVRRVADVLVDVATACCG